MNYSNGKPIGCNYSGDQASGAGYINTGTCTVDMTFKELRKTWRLKERYEKDIVQHSGFGDIPEDFQDSTARGL